MGEIFGALLTAILEPVLAVLGHLLINLVLLVLMFPVFCVLSTPYILVSSLFGAGAYADKVARSYQGLWKAMAQIGIGNP